MKKLIRFIKIVILAISISCLFTCADVDLNNPNDPANGLYPVADFYINGGIATSIYAPQPVTISAESTANPSGSALQYRWLFANDGAWTDWLSVPTITRNYSTLGTETVTLEVINEEERIDNITKVISIVDSNVPTASFTFSPTSPVYGAVVTFDASGSTDDDSSAAKIQVRWDFENDGAFNTEWSAEKTATHVYDTVGDYTAKLAVKDKYGLMGDVTNVVAVKDLPKEGLVAYYPLNGNANDESGNGYDGTVLGGATVNDVLVIGDNASDRLSLPNTIVNGLGDFTFSAELKIDIIHTTGTDPENCWISCARASEYNAFMIYYRPTYKFWRMRINNSYYDFNINSLIEDHDWHHVIVIRIGSVAKFYIDGSQGGDDINVSGTQLAVDTGGFIIGQEQDSFGGGFAQNQSFAGQVDNLRIYNRALTESEIQALYNEGGWTGK